MFSEPAGRHHAAHFHAYYQEHVAIFGISPVTLLAGSIPQRQQRLVEAWAELHQDELLADWELLQAGRKPAPIQPLR
ncbi:MAG: DUF4160 domain-containing protein [Verrucomicrobia bacterium]|nr:DUF4160 domain-containing protein [Verrucomicrobiota bacterium]